VNTHPATHRIHPCTLVLFSFLIGVGAALAPACGESGGGGATAPDGGMGDATASDAPSSSDSAMSSDIGNAADGAHPLDSGAGDVGAGGDSSSGLEGGSDGGAEACALGCAPNQQSVVDCDGNVVQACPAGEWCDPTTNACAAACTAAANAQGSIGCEYYATRMGMDYADQCYAVFVTNASSTPAHIAVEFFTGTPLPVANFTRLPSGAGSGMTYAPYDATAGLPPGQVAILFLGGSPSSNVPCPAAASVAQTAVPNGSLVQGTAVGQSFHVTTDVPVAAYQMNPYGGGAAAITGASELIPTSAWDTNYVAVTAAPYSSTTMDSPSLNIVAAMDGTQVTILPAAAVVGGGTLPAGPANMPYTFTLNQGQQAQFSQQADLTGTIIQTTHPVGVMGGNACMQEPLGTGYCDHGEQMIPPVKAMGSEYVGVMFRPRVTGDKAFWRVVGAVNGTTLAYVPAAPAGAPTMLGAGQVVEFITDVPFVVSSQDDQHPFQLFTLMSGAEWTALSTPGYGDPDFVLDVPTRQYGSRSVFYADGTFPENDVVVVRAKNGGGTFDDVTLDCVAGPLSGWQAVGNYEWTRVDLTSHDFANQGSCSAGRHEASSPGPFGLWMWGWGSPETQGGTCTGNTAGFSCYVSYGYPGTMAVRPVNGVVIPPVSH
jgi:hypothetical protein